MADLKLKLGVWAYDRTRGLFDGSIKPQGIELGIETSNNVGTIMERMVRDRAFDASELGFTYYLRTLEAAGAPFIAIPVFPNRIFRHSAIFVNAAKGIASPADLAGRRVGELHRYGHDAGIWAKGMLRDEYGVKAEDMIHVIGGMDGPLSGTDWAPVAPPPRFRIEAAARGLDAMLEAGEIDALFSASVPPSLIKGSLRVAPLFPDPRAAERDYFRRTGIFPMMHTVVIQRDYYEKNRWVASALMQAFEQAKARAVQEYRIAASFHGAQFMVPWLPALLQENRDLMGEDWWPYGLEKNRTAIAAFLRYQAEQGLSQRRWTVEELFAPECL